MVWYFIGVYIINRTLHGRLEIRNFSACVEKYFTRSLRSLEEKFLSPRGHVISSTVDVALDVISEVGKDQQNCFIRIIQ